MALGINTQSGGDFLPVVKYDARAGRWSRVDRSINSFTGQWESRPEDITQVFGAVFDFASIQTGWIDYTTPSFVLAPLGKDHPAKPGEKFKEGFRLPVKLAKAAGGDVREFSSTAKAVVGAVSELHDAYLEGEKGNAGMLPVVAMTGVRAIVTKTPQGSTTNYSPILRIERWVNRPPDLPLDPDAKVGASMPKTQPPSTSSAAVPPPQQHQTPTPQQQLPQQAGADNANDFG
jgi:hypothetical protein